MGAVTVAGRGGRPGGGAGRGRRGVGAAGLGGGAGQPRPRRTGGASDRTTWAGSLAEPIPCRIQCADMAGYPDFRPPNLRTQQWGSHQICAPSEPPRLASVRALPGRPRPDGSSAQIWRAIRAIGHQTCAPGNWEVTRPAHPADRPAPPRLASVRALPGRPRPDGSSAQIWRAIRTLGHQTCAPSNWEATRSAHAPAQKQSKSPSYLNLQSKAAILVEASSNDVPGASPR